MRIALASEINNLFTGQTLSLEQANDHSGLPLAQIFSYFPVALFVNEAD